MTKNNDNKTSERIKNKSTFWFWLYLKSKYRGFYNYFIKIFLDIGMLFILLLGINYTLDIVNTQNNELILVNGILTIAFLFLIFFIFTFVLLSLLRLIESPILIAHDKRLITKIESKKNVKRIVTRFSVYISAVIFTIFNIKQPDKKLNYIIILLTVVGSYFVMYLLFVVVKTFKKDFLQNNITINSIINDYDIYTTTDSNLNITNNYNVYWVPRYKDKNIEYFALNLQSPVKLDAEIEGTFDENKNTLLFLPYSKKQIC